MPADNHVFATLDPVQRYALGNLCIVLLHHRQSPLSPSSSSTAYATSSSSSALSPSDIDMNALAFARTCSVNILEALDLRPGQKQAILALNPTDESRDHVIEQCAKLIGDLPHRLHAIQALLALSVASGLYDARSRAFLSEVAMHLGIAWPAVAAIELSLAAHLFHSQIQAQPEPDSNSNSSQPKQVIDIDKHIAPYFSPEHVPIDSVQNFQLDDNNRNHDRNDMNLKAELLPQSDQQPQPQNVGNPFASASSDLPPSTSTRTPSIYDIDDDDSSLPSIDQLKSKRRRQKQRVRKAMKIGGITLVGGVLFGLTGGLIAPALLTALAGVGVTSAAGLAASGSLASGAFVGGLFGVAGGGFTLKKARNRISTNLDEFDFERPDDERVVAARAEKEAKERKKSETKQLTAGEADGTQDKVLAIEYDTITTTTVLDSKGDINVLAQEKNGDNSNENSFDSDIDIDVDMEKELPTPVPSSLNSSDDDVKQKPSQLETIKKKKKNSKVKVGARGLEAVANIPSLHLCICVPAWLGDREYGSALEQFEPGLQAELPYSQHLALRWESRRLYEMGLAFAKFWASKATVTTIQQAYPHALAAASSVAGAVAFAFAVPLTVMSCMDYIDNPWSILVSRSNGAGEELANVLVERSYGERPVSLFGYSVGARVIFKALECLAERKALGIVQDVFFTGAPVTADPERWLKIRPVVAGRLVNAYMNYDWALAFLHRGCGHGVYVSGLRKVDTVCVENMNLAYLGIEGHQELNNGIFRSMHAMGVGLGYITMPPAKLVIKGGGKIGVMEQKVVCEEPGGAEWAVDPEEAEREEEEDAKKVRTEDEENVEQQGNVGTDGGLLSKGKQKSKSKSKGRKPWGWWYSSSNKGGNRSGHTKSNSNTNGDFESNAATDIAGNVSVVAESSGTTSNPGPSAVTLTTNTTGSTSLNASNPSDVEGSQEVTATSEVKDNEFDWELQRRIWEEQERQISQRGYEYADSARVVALQGRVMLDLSVEVAGRRLERLIAQDSMLPVSTRTQVFTNCVDSQRGMQVRIYEHYPRTKSVASNMPKWEKTHVYPKVLADLELRLRKDKPKGSLRVQVGLSMDDDGNLHVTAHEFFDKQMEIGERVSAVVERAKLCSVEERVELEAKEAEKRRREREKARLAIEAPVDSVQHSDKVPESVS